MVYADRLNTGQPLLSCDLIKSDRPRCAPRHCKFSGGKQIYMLEAVAVSYDKQQGSKQSGCRLVSVRLSIIFIKPLLIKWLDWLHKFTAGFRSHCIYPLCIIAYFYDSGRPSGKTADRRVNIRSSIVGSVAAVSTFYRRQKSNQWGKLFLWC